MVTERLWQVKAKITEAIAPELLAACQDSPLLAKLLMLRGIHSAEEAQNYLNLEEYTPTPPQEFPDMDAAVARIQQAIETQEPVLVYGDFDVDGITGTAILVEALTALGVNVSFYVPSRHNEGHGLHSAALMRLVSSRSLKLVITTDTGVSNFNEISLLKGLGVDTIVTDHHELPDNLPPAVAILNPKLLPESSPFAYLCGAGVAYQLIKALVKAQGAEPQIVERLLDLTAIGTVVDMVPLKRENRYLVWKGLQTLGLRQRVGLKAILTEANVNDTAPITATTLGFTLGPRLNAVGRLGDATDGVILLTTQDPEVARSLATKLEFCNRQRRELVDQAEIQAQNHLIKSGELTGEKAIIICSKEWNQGIVGLVATRLIEKYSRPCFVGCVDDESGEIRFSARSIPSFDMHANLKDLENLFIRWGGHAGAAGFAIKQQDLQVLKNRLFTLCRERIQDVDMIPVTTVDLVVQPSQVNPFLIDIIDRMAPFGMDNPMPILGLEGVTLGAQKTMGDDGRHLKLILPGDQAGQFLEAIYWNWGADRPKLNPKHKFRLAFTAEINTYNGANKVQLLLKDIQDESISVGLAPQTQIAQPTPVSALSEQAASPTSNSPRQQPEPEASSVSTAPAASDASPSTVVGVASSVSANQPQWIDHRKRERLEDFFAEVIQGLGDSNNGFYRIFSEGTQSFVPLPLPESTFCHRATLTALSEGGHLLLWDLPPTAEHLASLITIQQPKVIHLLGGKYRKIPIYRDPKAIIDGFFKVLQKQSRDTQSSALTIGIEDLALRLATTPSVVRSGLMVLEGLQAVALQKTSTSPDLMVTLLNAPVLEQADTLVSFDAFCQTLDDVCRYRQWLMSADLSVIQSGVALARLSPSLSSSSFDASERTPTHASSLR